MTVTEERLLSDPNFARRMAEAAAQPTEPLDFDDV